MSGPSAPPVTSGSVSVFDQHMHFCEVGSGPPVLFLHGNPTSSFLWRNVIGQVAQDGRRCIALDLIGMGRSGKPDIDYRLADHIRYVDAFVDAMGLSDVVIVGHDWGAVIALDRLARFPRGTRGVALLEGHIHPVTTWDDMGDGAELFRLLRTPVTGERMISDENVFIEVVLPGGMLRTLAAQEWDAYREPFRDPTSRRPMWRWPNEIPIDGTPADVAALITRNQSVIADPMVSKLLMHARPGAVIGADEVAWCRENGRSLRIVDLGEGTHFLPEDLPDEISAALCSWLDELR